MEKAKFKVLLFLLVITSNCTSPIKEDVENKTAKKDVPKTKMQLEKRVPAGPNPYADQYWDAPCHCWKPGKKPKPLIKLANPPLSPLYFIYQKIYDPWYRSAITRNPKPPARRDYHRRFYIDSWGRYVFYSVNVMGMIHYFDSKFPLKSIKNIRIKGQATNFIEVVRGKYVPRLGVYQYGMRPKKSIREMASRQYYY